MSESKQKKLSEHVRQRTREWFRKAEHELVFLEHAPFDVEDPPTDTAGKMAHMVAEYCLKAYLVLNKKKIERIHDLGEILDDCIAARQDSAFEDLRDDCMELMRYKTDFVYPGPVPEVISVEEARNAIAKARHVMNFVVEKAMELGYYSD